MVGLLLGSTRTPHSEHHAPDYHAHGHRAGSRLAHARPVRRSEQRLHNAWGEKHLAIINSTALGNPPRWAESDLFVLRHHDNKLAPSVPISWFSPQDPLIDFRKILNNESKLQEDLVIYFNLGNHHAPTTQDIPNTLIHTWE